jgi:hypothetical protein
MIQLLIIALVLGAFGAFFIRLGLRQVKTGVAWTNFGGVFGPITRQAAPLFYWPAVAGSFFFGAIMLLVAVSMLIG